MSPQSPFLSPDGVFSPVLPADFYYAGGQMSLSVLCSWLVLVKFF